GVQVRIGIGGAGWKIVGVRRRATTGVHLGVDPPRRIVGLRHGRVPEGLRNADEETLDRASFYGVTPRAPRSVRESRQHACRVAIVYGPSPVTDLRQKAGCIVREGKRAAEAI